MTTREYVIGLGANLGDRRATLVGAVVSLARLGESTGGALLAVSSLYETEPVGPPQPRYLNAAASLATRLEPTALLGRLLDVELAAGRIRRERWGPRTLDLDVLWSPGLEVSVAGLRVPHSRLRERPFALVPLLELVPDAMDPRGGRYRDLPAAGGAGVSRIAGPGWDLGAFRPERV